MSQFNLFLNEFYNKLTELGYARDNHTEAASGNKIIKFNGTTSFGVNSFYIYIIKKEDHYEIIVRCRSISFDTESISAKLYEHGLIYSNYKYVPEISDFLNQYKISRKMKNARNTKLRH